jgi:hypothetical protein
MSESTGEERLLGGNFGAPGYSSLIPTPQDLQVSWERDFFDTTASSEQSTRPSSPISAFIRSVQPRRATLSTLSGAGFVDLRSLDYVTIPNENLLCPICTSPLVKPMELGCEHIFCEDCLYDHLQSGIQSASVCPKCRDSIDSIRPVPKLLNHLLDELEAICPNKSAGCLAYHKRYTMADHVNSYCEFTEVSCPAVDCLQPVQRRFLEERCLHSEIECGQCEEMVMEMHIHVSFGVI